MSIYKDIKAKEPQILEMIRKYRETGNVTYRNDIITTYHPLCEYAAVPFHRAGLRFMITKAFDIDDFVTEAIFGVIKAIDNYDFSFKQPFVAYALIYMKSFLVAFIAKYGEEWKNRTYKYFKLEKISSTFLAENGYVPDIEELKSLSNLSAGNIITNADIKTFLKGLGCRRRRFVSKEISEEKTKWEEQIPQPNHTRPIECVDAELDAKVLIEPFLKRRCNKFYVLNKFYGYTQSEIAKAYGSTKGAVCMQICKARRESFGSI